MDEIYGMEWLMHCRGGMTFRRTPTSWGMATGAVWMLADNRSLPVPESEQQKRQSRALLGGAQQQDGTVVTSGHKETPIRHKEAAFPRERG